MQLIIVNFIFFTFRDSFFNIRGRKTEKRTLFDHQLRYFQYLIRFDVKLCHFIDLTTKGHEAHKLAPRLLRSTRTFFSAIFSHLDNNWTI